MAYILGEKPAIKRINGKFYDFGTKNKSFLQLARDLKLLGIKNYYFMLEVCDPHVTFVDPYKENITANEVMMVSTEVTKNMWYYLREVCRIPDSGGTYVQFLANRGNIAQAWCFRHGIDSWLNLPRQRGKTMSALADQSWAYSFGTTNSQFIFINKAGEDAKTNLGRIKKIIELLPKYLQYEQVYTEDGKIVKHIKNATTMKHPITKNEIIVKAKATSHESALNIARGLTAPIQHFDELEFTSRVKTILENSAPTYEKAASRAKENGAIYGRIITSTPGDLDTQAGMDAQILLDKTAKFTEDMYDWSEADIEEYIHNNSENDIVYIEFSYKQLGLTEEWFDKISRKIGDRKTVRREVLLQRLRGSSSSPFDYDDIEYLVSTITPPIQNIYLGTHFRLDVYEKLKKNIPYIVGIDCSTGTNGDYNAITVLNPYTVRPVAEFRCKYIGETDFINIINELVTEHIPRAILAIERNHVGDAIVDILMHSKLERNLYYDKGKDLLTDNINAGMTTESILKLKAESKKFVGVYTQGKTREQMMSILLRHVAEFKDDFVCANIINDIAKLVQNASGKILAVLPHHDDSVMSYLIAMYVYYHGNNLAMFGFIKGSAEIENQNQGMKTIDDVDKSLLPPEVVEVAERQQALENAASFQDIASAAIIKAQQETRRLANAGLINNNIHHEGYDPDDDYVEDDSTMSLDIFDELNCF